MASTFRGYLRHLIASHADQLIDLQRFCPPADDAGTKRSYPKGTLAPPHSCLAEDNFDLILLAERFQAACDIHDITNRGVAQSFGRTDIADKSNAGVDA